MTLSHGLPQHLQAHSGGSSN